MTSYTQDRPGIPIHMVPAYGRDYHTEAEVLTAWQGGRDFKIQDISQGRLDGAYTSCRDWPPTQSVMLRFHHLERFVITRGHAHEGGRPNHA
jgi:hypothetical protein